jgi:CBS domain-containing protein
MPTAIDILRSKSASEVHCIDPASTVFDAINKMNHHHIGSLLVTVGGQVVGMFTERDVLRRVVAPLKDPLQTQVAEVMTPDVITVKPDTDFDDISSIMQTKRVRHLPVCDDNGQVYGVLSIGDLNAYRTQAQESTIHLLNDYIYGRA